MYISIIAFNISLPNIVIKVIASVFDNKNFSSYCTEYNVCFSINVKITNRITSNTYINRIRDLKTINRIKVIYNRIVLIDVHIRGAEAIKYQISIIINIKIT